MELLHILTTALNAVAPMVLLMALGYVLKRMGVLNQAFLDQGNTLVFKLFLPTLLFANIYDIEGFGAIPWDVVTYGMVIAIVLVILGMVAAPMITKVPERKGVIAQAAYRSNMAIIGLPLAATLGGAAATAVASVVSSFTIALFNVVSVVVLTVFLDTGKKRIDPGKLLKDILKNPPVIGIFLGFACMTLRALQTALWGQPVFTIREDIPFLYSAINQLRNVLSPFALLVLGGQFTFSAVKELRREIVAGSLFRLIFAPLLGISLAVLLNHVGIIRCGVNEYPALIALLGSPVAVGSNNLAAVMGNDEQLATQLVVWTSVFSAFTLFGVVCVMMGLGLLAV